MICIKTTMQELPKNCWECKVLHCNLPQKKNTYKDEMKKVFSTKRHEDCPLIELKEGEH